MIYYHQLLDPSSLKQTALGISQLVLRSFPMMLICKDLKMNLQENEFLALTIVFIFLSIASLMTHVQGQLLCFSVEDYFSFLRASLENGSMIICLYKFFKVLRITNRRLIKQLIVRIRQIQSTGHKSLFYQHRQYPKPL